MNTPASLSRHERKTRIINFRVADSESAQLENYLNAGAGLASVDKVARKIMLEALAEREKQRRLASFRVDKLASVEVFEGEAAAVLSQLPAKSFDMCLTSPPYWRKRDYRHPDQLGQERMPDQYIDRLASMLTQVHRVLRDDGTLWLNVDDTYHRGELMGIPWKIASELQRRGWHWRSEIIWAKTPKPESVKNRPTRAHEVVLLFSKGRDYFYDFEAVLEPHDKPWSLDCIRKAKETGFNGRPRANPFSKAERREKNVRGITRAEYGALMNPNGKNRRDVWSITPAHHSGEHSAVMPIELAELCIKAGSRTGGVVFDPFCGSGTSGLAALKHGRRFVGIELLPRFVREANERLREAGATGSAIKVGKPTGASVSVTAERRR